MKYHNIVLPSLSLIQEKVQRAIPIKYDIFPGLTYLPNNKELFLSIPELSSALVSLGLLDYIDCIAVNTFWKTTSPIHRDSGYSKYSLNIPLCGYKGTYLEYFTTDVEPIKKSTASFVNTELDPIYYDYPIESCILDTIVPTDCPVIINIKQPHRFINPHSEKRSILLIRLRDCPEVDTIVANLE